MKSKVQKSHPKTNKANNDEKGHVGADKGFEKRINLLVGELNAVFTCSNEFLIFKRFLTRTMVMLKKERSLLEIWKRAIKYRQEIELERNNLLEALTQLRKELKLDEKLPSLIKQAHQFPPVEWEYSEKKSKFLNPVPGEPSVSWINDVYDWCNSERGTEFLSEEEADLYVLAMRWWRSEPTWYHIGEHPVKTFALLLCICDHIEFLFKNDWFFSSTSPSGDEAKKLLKALRPIVANLIAELPIIKSWGKFSVKAIEWKEIAAAMALEIWWKDRTKSRPAMARLILPGLKGQNITEETIINHLALIDPRSSEEIKQSQCRKSQNIRL